MDLEKGDEAMSGAESMRRADKIKNAEKTPWRLKALDEGPCCAWKGGVGNLGRHRRRTWANRHPDLPGLEGIIGRATGPCPL